MKNNMIRDAMDTINPTAEQKARMRAAIAAQLPREEPVRREYRAKHAAPRRLSWIPAAAALFAVVVTGGFVLGSLKGRNPGNLDATNTTTAEETVPAAYQSVIRKYADAIDQDWSGEQCSQADISILTRDVVSTDNLGYALRDLDGDGVDELLITDGKVIYDLYALNGETTAHFLSGSERNAYFLCQQDRICNRGASSASLSFCRLYQYGSGTLELVDGLVYDGGQDPDHPWFSEEPLTGELTPLSEEEYNALLETYRNVDIAYSPVSDFAAPLEEAAVPDAADLNLYAAAIRREQAEFAQSEPMTYVFYDYDGDGQTELLLGSGKSALSVLKLTDGQVYTRQLTSASGNAYLCEDGVIKFTGYQNGQFYYTISRIIALDEMEFLEMLSHDSETESWTHRQGDVGSPASAIDAAEAERILHSYVELRLNWKPISQFPVQISAEGTLVTPVEFNADVGILGGGTACVSFDVSAVYTNSEGELVMELTIHDYERFDASDIAALQAGSQIALNGTDVTVETVESKSGRILINGGFDNGGYTLAADSDGYYFEVGANDAKSFFVSSASSFRINKDFCYIEAHDASQTGVEYDFDEFLAMLKKDDRFFSPTNTTATIQDGEILSITHTTAP